jgi:hypothetical protein
MRKFSFIRNFCFSIPQLLYLFYFILGSLLRLFQVNECNAFVAWTRFDSPQTMPLLSNLTRLRPVRMASLLYQHFPFSTLNSQHIVCSRNLTDEWLTLLLLIQGVPTSNLFPKTVSPYWGSLWFYQYLKVNAGLALSFGRRLLSFIVSESWSLLTVFKRGKNVRLAILTAVRMTMTSFPACKLLCRHQSFRETHCLHIQRRLSRQYISKKTLIQLTSRAIYSSLVTVSMI